MSDKRQLGATMSAVLTARQPRVVMVGGLKTNRIADELRRQGWDVQSMPTGDDLACRLLTRRPTAVVLPVDLDWESGYLVAAKLRDTKRKLRVILVAPKRSPEQERFAKFVGATLVAETDGSAKLLSAITG